MTSAGSTQATFPRCRCGATQHKANISNRLKTFHDVERYVLAEVTIIVFDFFLNVGTLRLTHAACHVFPLSVPQVLEHETSDGCDNSKAAAVKLGG